MSAPATNGWSVINLLRSLGVASATKAAIHAKWEAGLQPPQTQQTINPAKVDDGVTFLVANGFATFDGTNVTATHVDADGKPTHLRRGPTGYTLEVLPVGASVKDGT